VLKQIRKVPCWPGIQAAFDFQAKFAAWLCAPERHAGEVTHVGLLPVCGADCVRDWLWDLLSLHVDRSCLVDDARRLAGLTPNEKASLAAWIEVAKDVRAQFSGDCRPWPVAPRQHVGWPSFKRLMQAFYGKWNARGVPFDAEGNAVVGDGITYAQFVKQFKEVHGARTCVLCGGALGTPQVDHWIEKASFPLLSMSPENLLPICYECNRTGVKGAAPTFKQGDAAAFAEWFHPFFRPGFGRFELRYAEVETTLRVCVQPNDINDARRVENLNSLLSLQVRWTSEFIAMYGELQKRIRRLIQVGRMTPTAEELHAELDREFNKLIPEEVHYELRSLMLRCSLEPARLDALVTEFQN
jgi:hypothetical protein